MATQHSWQVNAAFPHQDSSSKEGALSSSAAYGVLNTGCQACSAVQSTSSSYVDVAFEIHAEFPPTPADTAAYLLEQNRRIRGQVHVRPSAALRSQSPEEIYLPMCDAMLADGPTASAHLSLRIPLHALTQDAVLSFSYYYDRHPPSSGGGGDDDGDDTEASGYLAPRGHCIYGGRMLLAVADLARGHGKGERLGSFSAEIHAVGLDECCERRPATPADLLVSLRLVATAHSPEDARRLRHATAQAPVNHLHMLRDMETLNKLSHRLEHELVAKLASIGPTPDCPEANRLFGRDTTDVFLVPASAFCMVPSSSDPRNPTPGTYAAWAAAAILSRELGSQRLFPVGALDLRRLLSVSGSAQHRAVLNAEQARIAAISDTVARENEWAILTANMVAGVTKFASYIADNVVCRGCGTAADGGRLELVGTDVSMSWVRAQETFNGDCDDLAGAAYGLHQTFRHSTVPLEHPLLEAMRDVMRRHYRTYLNNVTAFAAKAGDPPPGAEGYGTVAADGVRRGVQGHLTCPTIPCRIDGRRVHLLNEGTTDYCVQHICNPRPLARRTLERCLRQLGGAEARAVGLTGENTTTFKYTSDGSPFYDHSGTLASCELYNDRNNDGQADVRITTVAAVASHGSGMRVGVPIDVLLDAEACQRRGVQLAPVGFASEEELQLIASEGLMLPGMVIPQASHTPGLSTEHMTAEASQLSELLAASKVLQKKRSAMQQRQQQEPLSYSFRSNRITRGWPGRVARLLERCECVVGADVYMHHVYEHLHGIVLTLSIAV